MIRVFLIFILLMPHFAKADFSIYASMLSTSLSTESSGASSFGGGFAFSLSDLGFADLEMGLEFSPKSFSSGSTSASVTSVSAPVGLRFFLGKIFTFSFGPYVSYQLSSGALQTNSIDYGAFGKGGLHFPMSKTSGVILEVGYAMGFANAVTGQSSQFRQMSYTLGFRFLN